MGINKKRKAQRNAENKRATRKKKSRDNKSKAHNNVAMKNGIPLPGLSFLKTLTGTEGRSLDSVKSVTDSKNKTIEQQLDGIQSL